MRRMRFWSPFAATVCLVTISPRLADAYRYVHEILPGEHLSQIAKRYHIPISRLMKLNSLKSSRVRAGKKLRIVTNVPSRPLRKVRYRVRAGDSFSRIARKHRMKLRLIKRLNPKIKKTLRVGKKIWVVVEDRRRQGGGKKNLFQLASGPGFRVRDPRRSWGTFTAVNTMNDVFSSYGRRFSKAPLVEVMDVSRRGGGYFPPHKSHRDGRDVDIRYPRKKTYRNRVRTTPETLSLKRAWYLVERFLRSGDVVYIFMDRKLQRTLVEYARSKGVSSEKLDEWFQYPRRGPVGIVRHDPGHDTHFHVRFNREIPRRKASRVARVGSSALSQGALAAP